MEICQRIGSSFWIAVAFWIMHTAHSLQDYTLCFTQWQIWGYSQQEMTIVPKVILHNFLANYYQQPIHLPPIEVWEVLVQAWREEEKGGEVGTEGRGREGGREEVEGRRKGERREETGQGEEEEKRERRHGSEERNKWEGRRDRGEEGRWGGERRGEEGRRDD